MAGNGATPLGVEELERRLRVADPAALLVSPRILRRVIKRDRNLPGIGLQVPHRKGYVIGSDALLRIVEPGEVGLGDRHPLPEVCILLARLRPERLAALRPADVLTRYWRLLFHARIHLALEQRVAEHKLTDARVRDRIHCIGQTEFEEIRAVLRQEDLLLPPRDDRAAYIEFAALYLELRYFARTLLPRYFPALQQLDCIDGLLADDVDAESLFRRTRLEGAEDPVPPTPEVVAPHEERHAPPAPLPVAATPSETRYRREGERATRLEAVGNLVKAAILRARALAVAPPEWRGEATAAVESDLDQLAERLRTALDLDAGQAREWRRLLAELLPHATGVLWPLEARLLYDLQTVCTDQERAIYALDLVEWGLSLGRRPIKRLLPGQQDILTLKHLRSALRRVPGARVPTAARARLAALLHEALHQTETRLRDRFRPRIGEVLHEVGLNPHNLPERVARAKLIEELLDLVVERGFLTMGDLRDALSRNNLKLPDLAGPREFLLGDPLIRGNRRLAVALDGIYRRGEIYLRWLQRLSSAAFGTVVGRLLVLYVVLPFGGSFVVLEGVQHLIHAGARLVGPAPPPGVEAAPEPSGDGADLPGDWQDFAPAPTEAHPHVHSPVHVVHWYTVLLLGLFVFALLHLPSFRRAVGRGLYLLYRVLRATIVDLPAAFLRLPAVRFVLDSRAYQLLQQLVLIPLLIGVGVAGLLDLVGIDLSVVGGLGLTAFLLAAVLLNTRAGRDLAEAVEDRLARTWHQIQNDIVPGLIRLILAVYKWLLEEVERFLYAVDERLRFKTGEGRLVTATKAALGVVWFFCTYVVRVGINLFVEPTVNPIKHFPVVTVTAKLIVPIIPALALLIRTPLEPLVGRAVAIMVATVVIFFLPGLAGFIVWELKENWRLYEANRAPTLRPVRIGHHGETMVRLLRPGFHSGTIPKLHARLRRAQRRGRWRAARNQREALAQVAEAVRHFVERELSALLDGSRSWGGLRVAVGTLELCSNRIRVELRCPQRGPVGAWMTFEDLSGWLVASVAEPGWLCDLPQDAARAFEVALAGFYKMAAVDLVRQQIRAALRPSAGSYGVTEEGLVVWPSEGQGCEVLYPLRDGPRVEPHTSVCPPTPLPAFDLRQLVFRATPVPWPRWVEAWERDQAGKDPIPELVDGSPLMPAC